MKERHNHLDYPRGVEKCLPKQPKDLEWAFSSSDERAVMAMLLCSPRDKATVLSGVRPQQLTPLPRRLYPLQGGSHSSVIRLKGPTVTEVVSGFSNVSFGVSTARQ